MSVGVFLSKSLSPRGGGDFVCSLDPQITLFSAYLIGTAAAAPAAAGAIVRSEGEGDGDGDVVEVTRSLGNFVNHRAGTRRVAPIGKQNNRRPR